MQKQNKSIYIFMKLKKNSDIFDKLYKTFYKNFELIILIINYSMKSSRKAMSQMILISIHCGFIKSLLPTDM